MCSTIMGYRKFCYVNLTVHYALHIYLFIFTAWAFFSYMDAYNFFFEFLIRVMRNIEQKYVYCNNGI